ncbi:MAG TPA: hypothetical protein VGO53_09440, partial [Steroidobacteraceae bacterium]|nr:hypothetical protein [Steroidobacteraceae bacterium]
MAKRDEITTRVSDVVSNVALSTRAALIGCFVSSAASLRVGEGEPLTIPAMSLAWMTNPREDMLALALSKPVPRGWWIEANPRTDASK